LIIHFNISFSNYCLKVISIPSVEIDRQAVKILKKANKYYDIMDTIPENKDSCYFENTSNVTKSQNLIVSRILLSNKLHIDKESE